MCLAYSDPDDTYVDAQWGDLLYGVGTTEQEIQNYYDSQPWSP
jgi:hypothetical protein